MNLLKALSAALAFILIFNMYFFAVGKIGWLLFWLIIIIAAILTFNVMPKIK